MASNNKAVIVTGAASGIGLAMTMGLINTGHDVTARQLRCRLGRAVEQESFSHHCSEAGAIRPCFAASMWDSTARAMLIGPAALIAMKRPVAISTPDPALMMQHASMVCRSIATAAATARALPQVHYLDRLAEPLGEAGRKQQPPVLAAPADSNQRRLSAG